MIKITNWKVCTKTQLSNLVGTPIGNDNLHLTMTDKIGKNSYLVNKMILGHQIKAGEFSSKN